MLNDSVSIKEASEKTGLSYDDIRYAKQIGLLEFDPADEYFSTDQLHSIEGIAHLKGLGLTIDEIFDLGLTEDMLAEIREYTGANREGKPYLELSSSFIRSSVQILDYHMKIIDSQIEQLDILKQNLSRKARTFRKLLNILESRSSHTA